MRKEKKIEDIKKIKIKNDAEILGNNFRAY